jgi:hypothetical protein
MCSSDPEGNSPRIAKGGTRAYTRWGCTDPRFDYIWTKGEKGEAPDFLSAAYNWAGHVFFRSGWTKDATWLFFEPGPRGSGHHDAACLNIQLQSKGKHILADPGFYSYSNNGEEGKMAAYLGSSAAHNTATVDNQSQPHSKFAYNTEPGDYRWYDNGTLAGAEGVYSRGYGEKGEIKVVHKRKITYYRNEDKFVVEDRFEGEGSHEISLHWQLPVEAEWVEGKKSFTILNAPASAQMNVKANKKYTITALKGSKDPYSGWFSWKYGDLHPTTTVHVKANGKLPVVIETTINIQ